MRGSRPFAGKFCRRTTAHKTHIEFAICAEQADCADHRISNLLITGHTESFNSVPGHHISITCHLPAHGLLFLYAPTLSWRSRDEAFSSRRRTASLQRRKPSPGLGWRKIRKGTGRVYMRQSWMLRGGSGRPVV